LSKRHGERASTPAATAAAAAVLIKLRPAESEAKVAQAREAYLAAIPDGEVKSVGVKLGNEAVIKAIASRANDGNDTPDALLSADPAGRLTSRGLWLFFLCEITGVRLEAARRRARSASSRSIELPAALSAHRVLLPHLKRMFEHVLHPELPTDFD
jgi:hypothetical protein